MTYEETEEIYHTIRAYYNFYIPKQVFCDSYYREFKDAKPDLIKKAIEFYCCKPYNTQPPTLTDVKSFILRRKWVVQYKYYNKRVKGTLTTYRAKQSMEAVKHFNMLLNGYGEEYDYWEKAHPLPPPKPKQVYTEEELDQFAAEIVALGELYDL